MSHVASNYLTLEEYIESQRSPQLPRSKPNWDPLDTPPPYVDAPEDYQPSDTEGELPSDHPTSRQASRGRPQPSSCDSLLINQLGPAYSPDIAARAGIELCCDHPDPICEDTFPDLAEYPSMIARNGLHDVSATSALQPHGQTGLRASRRASEMLNDAITYQCTEGTVSPRSPTYPVRSTNQGNFTYQNLREKKRMSISITSLASDDTSETPDMSQISLQPSQRESYTDHQTVRRPVLPSLNVNSTQSLPSQFRSEALSTSPALAKFAIAPSHGHPSQTLPRLYDHMSPASATAASPEARQTLPSLQTALNSATDSNGTPYPEPSSAVNRLSPSRYTRGGTSPAAFSQASPPTILSPPRLVHPNLGSSSWRTLSNTSSNSAMSDYISGSSSNSVPTPVMRGSPSHSASTPQYPVSDYDSFTDSELTMVGTAAEQPSTNVQPNTGAQQGYPCTYSGCPAAPFQTQYLLNSHTNVHSNQRPHYCPVDGCPRGPGGQGFKRKNEMIRHGLVHQSPGYVCPFCPDQQHKYPRPDNLQRHVRVHHVEKERDDPQLRDVLAQRPEGGNRGRRRRLGG